MIVYGMPGLSGIELWRGISRGATLYQLREQKQEYFRGLREFLVQLHAGHAEAADERETASLVRAAGFARVILCGGEALHPLLDPALRAESLLFALEIDRVGPYTARRGALRIFESMGWRRGVALDLGQLQLKVMSAFGDASVARDLDRLPVGAHALDPAAGRSGIRDLIRKGLKRVPESPDGVVLGLPVELDEHGVARSATYPGLFGPVESIFSGLFPCPWVVLNDAVLAALSFPLQPGEKTLVVTLGFGIGGALWEG